MILAMNILFKLIRGFKQMDYTQHYLNSLMISIADNSDSLVLLNRLYSKGSLKVICKIELMRQNFQTEYKYYVTIDIEDINGNNIIIQKHYDMYINAFEFVAQAIIDNFEEV